MLALLNTVITFKCITGDFWLAGMIIYANIVLIATLKIAQKMNNHTWVSSFFLIGSVLSFWAAVAIESIFPSIEATSGIFMRVRTMPSFYLVMLWAAWVAYG